MTAKPHSLGGWMFLLGRIVLQLLCAIEVAVPWNLEAAEYHVTQKSGDDRNPGSEDKPFRTIGAGAKVAIGGDTITVHDGVYRERVTPPRGGDSDTRRIIYRVAPGNKAEIKGSEVIKHWMRVSEGVWQVKVTNSLFGSYNPYKDKIEGDWFGDRGRVHHTGEVYLNGKSLYETHLIERVFHPVVFPDSRDHEGSTWTWYCESDAQSTYIYANFHGVDPNREMVEINVRESCFYPDKPGCDYITVQGFRMAQAATQWAAPTAEQIGLIGTHWSKGWIIEGNEISDSKCSGITLGKDRATGHNVWNKDPTRDGALHYVDVIKQALAAGWDRGNIGGHLVRNNVIHDCEQTGICGSLGAVFSRITSNHIYQVWAKRQFNGAEMAGIKLHAAIDVVIEHNRIHNAGRGMWMDWMAQGTRITGNVCYDNTTDDLFLEVNHGPFVVDHNLLLSNCSIREWSEGGLFAHNLLLGRIDTMPERSRATPYHLSHSTALAGLVSIEGGDHRFINNVFLGSAGASGNLNPRPGGVVPERAAGYGTWVYGSRKFPIASAGNVYLGGAEPCSREVQPVVVSKDAKGHVRIEEAPEMVDIVIEGFPDLRNPTASFASVVTGESIGKARVTGLPFENADGSSLRLDRDMLGYRHGPKPCAGPLEGIAEGGTMRLRVW